MINISFTLDKEEFLRAYSTNPQLRKLNLAFLIIGIVAVIAVAYPFLKDEDNFTKISSIIGAVIGGLFVFSKRNKTFTTKLQK